MFFLHKYLIQVVIENYIWLVSNVLIILIIRSIHTFPLIMVWYCTLHVVPLLICFNYCFTCLIKLHYLVFQDNKTHVIFIVFFLLCCSALSPHGNRGIYGNTSIYRRQSALSPSYTMSPQQSPKYFSLINPALMQPSTVKIASPDYTNIQAK